MGIRRKITTPREPAVLFEIVPPPVTADLDSSIGTLGQALDKLSIDAVNIPEVCDAGDTPRYHAHEVARALRKNGASQLPIILNHPVVYDTWKKQQAVFNRIYKPLDISSIVLVGGASSRGEYPGPSVPEAASLFGAEIKQNGFRPLLGSITIQTRKKELDIPL